MGGFVLEFRQVQAKVPPNAEMIALHVKYLNKMPDKQYTGM